MRKLECRREALFQYRGLPPVGMAVSMGAAAPGGYDRGLRDPSHHHCQRGRTGA